MKLSFNQYLIFHVSYSRHPPALGDNILLCERCRRDIFLHNLAELLCREGVFVLGRNFVTAHDYFPSTTIPHGIPMVLFPRRPVSCGEVRSWFLDLCLQHLRFRLYPTAVSLGCFIPLLVPCFGGVALEHAWNNAFRKSRTSRR